MRMGLFGLGWVGCGGPDDAASGPCVVAAVGPAGGSVTHGGFRLDVPAGALAESFHLTVCEVTDPAGPEPTWEIRPNGLPLAVPATVTLESAGELFGPDPDGAPVRSLQAVHPTPSVVRGPVYRLGTVSAALDPRALEPYAVESPPLDVLFVVDDSSSMDAYQQELETTFEQSFPILSTSGADYHVGVVTTDLDHRGGGQLRQVDGRRWIDRSTPDPIDAFSRLATPGISGSATEQGLGAAYLAIEVLGDGYNAGFRRFGADLEVVVVSDEEDETPNRIVSPSSFVDWLLEQAPSPALGRLHAIVTPPGRLASGTRYIEVAEQTGGELVDIDHGDWSKVFDALASGRDAPMLLGAPAAPDTVEAWWVPPSTEPVPLAVVYDPATNGVRVELGQAPAAEVVVLYLAE